MATTNERQRAAARARLEREMAERAAAARKRRQLQASIGAGIALLLVVAGTVWLVSSLGDDDDNAGTPAAQGSAGPRPCEWIQLQGEQRTKTTKDVGLPPTSVPTSGTRTMTVDTNLGQIQARLDLSKVPCTAASFAHLGSKGFFDGSKCHRLVTEGLKVLQCGDPSGTGAGGPAYEFPTQVTGDETYPRGTVAMANSGQGFDGSQFFLVHGDSQLPPDYTVLGTIDEAGLATLDAIAANGNDGSNGPGDGAPTQEVRIQSLTVAA